MSNKIVPAVYRSVIDDVVANIKPDFDEYGVSEDVLAELQSKWEKKVMESRVADFDPPVHHHPAPAYSAPPAPTHPSLHNYAHYAFPPPSGIPGVKAEQTEYSYGGYGLAPPRPPAGYTANSGGSGGRIPQLDGPSGSYADKGKAAERLRGGAGLIPQLDGSSSGSSASPPPPTLHSAHPSLAASAPPAASNGAADDEAINSDLDDSDTDGNDDEDDGGVGGDIMFCTYDKVARVKNKWKCVLKDGMVSIDGRDYLFSKCNGEFEW